MGRIAEACEAHGKLARGCAETEAQIEEYWRLGCKVLNLSGNDVSTWLDGLKARAGRAHARLKSIGVPVPSGAAAVGGCWLIRITAESPSPYGPGMSAHDPNWT